MKVIIASQRVPKVNGVKRAFVKLAHLTEFQNITFETLPAESGVKATPLSMDELLTGARRRAEAVFPKRGSHDEPRERTLSIGVEGGVTTCQSRAFLQSWACVYDGTSMSFGSSGSIEIPAALADAVVKRGEDLGVVIDTFAGQRNVRSKQGTWGILTNDLLTREDSFELATLNALAPFFNQRIYSRGTSP